MLVNRSYSFFKVLKWTRIDILKFTIIATVPVVLYKVLNLQWLALPWMPTTLVGTAVAFYVGFKNNSSYDRLWESRKIWGAIVNDSRTWGIKVLDFVNNDFANEPVNDQQLKAIHQRLIYRHIAWLTALRFQLRTSRTWEHPRPNLDKARQKKGFDIVEFRTELSDEISPYLDRKEKEDVLNRKNAATQLIKRQSQDLKELRKMGLIDDFRHMSLTDTLEKFYTGQGKSERIKNYPFPRQYATLNGFFIWMFIVLLPLSMIKEFDNIKVWGESMVWLTIPFCVMVSWVFNTMEKVGDYSENPFEGGPNDTPITALSRTIEIDLRDMLDENELPKSIPAINHILS